MPTRVLLLLLLLLLRPERQGAGGAWEHVVSGVGEGGRGAGGAGRGRGGARRLGGRAGARARGGGSARGRRRRRWWGARGGGGGGAGGGGGKATAKWRVFTDRGRELFQQGRADEAESFLSRAVDEARRGFGEGDGHVAAAYQNLAELLRLRGDLERAEGFYLQALRILEAGAAAPGGGGPFPRQTTAPNEQVAGAAYGAAQHNVAGFYLVKGELREARRFYEQALATKARALGPRHQECAATAAHLAEVLRQQGETSEALKLLRFAVGVLEELGQGGSPQGVRRTLRLAELLAIGGASGSAGRAEAAGLLQRVHAQLEDSEGPESVPARRISRELAALLVERAARRDGDAEDCRPKPCLPRESAFLSTLGALGSGTAPGRDRSSAVFAAEAARLLRLEEERAGRDGRRGKQSAKAAKALSQSLLARAEALQGALGPARAAAELAVRLAAERLAEVETSAREAAEAPEQDAARRLAMRQLMMALEGFCHAQLSLAGVFVAEGSPRAADEHLVASMSALGRVEKAAALLTAPVTQGAPSRRDALPREALAAWSEQLRRVRADFCQRSGACAEGHP